MKEAMRLTTAQRIPTDRVRLLGEKCGRVGVPKKKGREKSGPKSAERSGCVHLPARINCQYGILFHLTRAASELLEGLIRSDRLSVNSGQPDIFTGPARAAALAAFSFLSRLAKLFRDQRCILVVGCFAQPHFSVLGANCFTLILCGKLQHLIARFFTEE